MSDSSAEISIRASAEPEPSALAASALGTEPGTASHSELRTELGMELGTELGTELRTESVAEEASEEPMGAGAEARGATIEDDLDESTLVAAEVGAAAGAAVGAEAGESSTRKSTEVAAVAEASDFEAVAPTVELAAAVPAPLFAGAPEWAVISVRARVDSFNQQQLLEEIRSVRASGAIKIALDLTANRFLSFPVIKTCVAVAREVAALGGSFVLVSCQEKTKRHFEIYGSLDDLSVVRSVKELDQARPAKGS